MNTKDLLLHRRMMMGGMSPLPPPPPPPDPATIPLTFNILTDGNVTWKIGAGNTGRTIEYSKNDGEWTAITSTSAGVDIPVTTGDVLKFRGNTWPATNASNHSRFASTCSFAAKGNPASLNYGDNLTGDESLETQCYNSLFYRCTGLTTAPELPATTLAAYCYLHMFQGCTGLTTAPELPATTLVTGCYQYMFQGCTGLTTAPELPATTLVTGCYVGMFAGCANLAYIKALFTTTPTTARTNSWVSGVASTGTFVKSASATWNVTGDSGIPSGWTIVKV